MVMHFLCLFPQYIQFIFKAWHFFLLLQEKLVGNFLLLRQFDEIVFSFIRFIDERADLFRPLIFLFGIRNDLCLQTFSGLDDITNLGLETADFGIRLVQITLCLVYTLVGEIVNRLSFSSSASCLNHIGRKHFQNGLFLSDFKGQFGCSFNAFFF